MCMTEQYIYLLRTSESLRLGETIFKVGQSTNVKNRLYGYSKSSELIRQVRVSDCKIAEKDMLLTFKNKFVQETQYGTEYFGGDFEEIVKMFDEIAEKYKANINNDDVKKIKSKINAPRNVHAEIELHKFKCICGNGYKYSQGLSKHKRVCKVLSAKNSHNEETEEEYDDMSESQNKDENDNNDNDKDKDEDEEADYQYHYHHNNVVNECTNCSAKNIAIMNLNTKISCLEDKIDAKCETINALKHIIGMLKDEDIKSFHLIKSLLTDIITKQTR